MCKVRGENKQTHYIYKLKHIHIYIYLHTHVNMHVFQNYFQTVLMSLLHGFSYVGLLINIYIYFSCFNKFVYLRIFNIFFNFFIYLKLAYIQPARAAFCTHPFARAAFYIHAPFCKGFLLHTLWQEFFKNSLL